jgi:hypothetical protein
MGRKPNGRIITHKPHKSLCLAFAEILQEQVGVIIAISRNGEKKLSWLAAFSLLIQAGMVLWSWKSGPSAD